MLLTGELNQIMVAAGFASGDFGRLPGRQIGMGGSQRESS